RPCERAERRVGQEVERSLQLLWGDVQFSITGQFLPGCRPHMAQVVEPTIAQSLHRLGPDERDLGVVEITAPAHRSPVRQARSEPMTRGTGCGKSARPDLWEPREGNDPGPPGRTTQSFQSLAQQVTLSPKRHSSCGTRAGGAAPPPLAAPS